ncbi:hypothetical protein OIV83_001769 [Microbotryomycetes sp. JL201]|nr:hypothetical protein OIV83_001769 [Microbotryomycetes sp. JL201]
MDDYTSPPHGPPAYALESSSSEEDLFEDAQHGQRRAQPKRSPLPEPAIDVQGQVMSGTNVIFLVGEGGEHVAKGVHLGQQDASALVTIDGQQMALIASQPSQTTLVFLSHELRLSSLMPLASKLMQVLAPSRTTVITSYHLSSYLSEIDVSKPPVLFLQSPACAETASLVDSKDLTPFAPPNMLHGLASCLLTLSALAGVPSLLLLLPSVAPPPPLNGPWPVSPSSNSFYDAGPTGLSNPTEVLQEVRSKLVNIASKLDWQWWRLQTSNGTGFEWLDKQRKQKRKQELSSSSMYM